MNREQRRAWTCARKVRFATWDDAEAACVRIGREEPVGDDPNPPAPYPCDHNGERHYHIGHIRTGTRP